VPPIVRIFSRKSRTRRTLGSHQIRVFCRRSKQLIGREARRELEEASAHIVGIEASMEAALIVTKHQSCRITVARLRCRPPPIKISLIEFPSSLWSRRSKPHRKLTTVARENPNSGEMTHSGVAWRAAVSHLIGDEWSRLEAEITLRGDRSWMQIAESTVGV
jgi:hypothetical protein